MSAERIEVGNPRVLEFVELVNKRTGVVVDQGKLPMLINCIRDRQKKRGLHDLEGYYNFLWFSPHGEEEIRTLVESVLINETLFYRNKDQMRLLEEVIFPALIEKRVGEEKIKIWSAACATGAEPYSLAICFEEVKERMRIKNKECEITVLATDISHSALEQAESATYHQRPVKNAPDEIIRKYFSKEKEKYRVVDPIRSKVILRHHNLLETGYPVGLDMIVCRNVLIYFNAETRKHIVEGFFNALKPDGLLMIGHSETLFDWPELFTPHFEHDSIFYTKWTTDRREFMPPGREKSHKSRRPPTLQEPAVFGITERVADGSRILTLKIAGLLDRNTPVDSLRKNLFDFLGRPASLKIIDITSVCYVTNHALRVIRQALAAEEGSKKEIFIAGGAMMENLITAALDDFAVIVKEVADISGVMSTMPESKAVLTTVRTLRREDHRRPLSSRERVDVQSPGIRPLPPAHRFLLKETSSGAVLEISGCLDPEEAPETNETLKKAMIDLVRRASESDGTASIILKEITYIAPVCIKILRRSLVLAREERVLLEFIVTEKRVREQMKRHGFPLAEGKQC